MSILGNIFTPERTENADMSRDVKPLSLPDDAGEMRLPDDSGESRPSRNFLDLHLPDDSGQRLPEKTDAGAEQPSFFQLEATLLTPEGFQETLERHPEKAEVWKNQLLEVGTLEELGLTSLAPQALSSLKGSYMETVVKDYLSDAGLTVEAKQRVLEGESGGTRPDVIAKNETGASINGLLLDVPPGETLSIECKCGQRQYLDQQLRNHIPNQLSGQEGHKALLVTSDIRNTSPGLAESVCEKYGASLIVLDVSANDIEEMLKEVARS